MKSKNSIAIIMPAYNEEKVLEKTIKAVIEQIKKIKKPDIKLIVVNDGSTDKTGKILENSARKFKNLTVLTHSKNKGFGSATRTAVSYTLNNGFTWALHMDSDLTNNPKYIHDFIAKISQEVDCIKASRYIKNSKIIGVENYRRLISLIGNSVAKYLFNVGVTDCTNGFRMVRLSLLKNVKFKENNFSIILEELYHLKKSRARFKEIPYTITARTSSYSHFVYKPKIFYDYFKYALKSFLVS